MRRARSSKRAILVCSYRHRSTSSASHRPALEMWTTTKTTKYGVGKSVLSLHPREAALSSPSSLARLSLRFAHFGAVKFAATATRSGAATGRARSGVTARGFAPASGFATDNVREDSHDGLSLTAATCVRACIACALTALRAYGCPCVCSIHALIVRASSKVLRLISRAGPGFRASAFFSCATNVSSILTANVATCETRDSGILKI